MTEETQYNKEKELLAKSALSPGTVLHNGRREYAVVKVLGAGGFGITYKVSSIIMVDNVPITTYFAVKEYFLKGCYRDGNSTALQCSPTMRGEVDAGRNDFINEAKRLNKLSGKSRNIVRVNETFEENGTAYYVMEYLDGGDLRMLAEGRGLTEGQSVSLLLPVAEAVAMLHEEHILHLDIKPDNIVMKTNETDGSVYPVLIDFGIAKHFDSKGRPTSHLLAKGASDGYAPIEQYTEIAAFSPQMDVYAIGATLLFLLTGKRPMKSFDITPAVIETCLPENVSAKTRQAVKAAMSRFKEERTPDVRNFISSIKKTYTLPLGYVLKGNQSCYRITEILGERDNSIIYKAVSCNSVSLASSVDGVKGGKSTAIITAYEIFEFFDGKVSVRSDDGHVIVRDGSDKVMALQMSSDAFLKTAKQTTGLSNVGDCSYDSRRNVNSEIFSANGTWYYVVQGKKKNSSRNGFVRGLRKAFIRTWRPLLGLCVCAAFIYSMILVSDSFNSHKFPAPKLSQIDTVSVKKENVVDSAKKNIEITKGTVDIPIITNTKVVENSDKLVKHNEKRNNNETREKKNETIQSETSTEQSKAKMLKAALELEDAKRASIIADLSLQGYVPAYYHYAKIFISSGNMQSARRYLELSIEAGVNVKQSMELLDMLNY